MGVRRGVPLDRRGSGIRALSGGPAAPPLRIRPAPPRWERGSRSFVRSEVGSAHSAIGSAAVSAIHQARTDPQWITPPESTPVDPSVERPHEGSGFPTEDATVAEVIQAPVLARRAAAAVIDAAVVAIAATASVLFALAMFGWHTIAPQLARGVDFAVDELLIGKGLVFAVAGLLLLLGFAYTTVAHAIAGATLGKALLGLEVVTREGELPPPGESAWRSVLAGLSLGAGGIGVAVALLDPHHLALHDRIVGTRVLKALALSEPEEA